MPRRAIPKLKFLFTLHFNLDISKFQIGNFKACYPVAKVFYGYASGFLVASRLVASTRTELIPDRLFEGVGPMS